MTQKFKSLPLISNGGFITAQVTQKVIGGRKADAVVFITAQVTQKNNYDQGVTVDTFITAQVTQKRNDKQG